MDRKDAAISGRFEYEPEVCVQAGVKEKNGEFGAHSHPKPLKKIGKLGSPAESYRRFFEE